MKRKKKRFVTESKMPFSLQCSNKECAEEIETELKWGPSGYTHHIECPYCGWVNKRKVPQATMDAWFNTGVDIRLRLVSESVEDIANILGGITTISNDERQRLYEIETNMQIINKSELTPTGTTDDDIEFE